MHRSGRWSGRANTAGIGAEVGHGGGGFSTPPLPTLVFDSPPFGGPAPAEPDFGAEVDELFEQPAAKPTISTKPAAIQRNRFIRSPELIANH
jgi:hypothetical protein